MRARFSRVMLLVMVVAAGSAGQAGAAAPQSSCGGDWVEAASCSFTYEGGGLALGGGAVGTPDAVVVTIEGPPIVAGAPNTVLLSCASGSTHFSGCAAVSTGPWIEVARGTVLTCSVRGTPGGSYGCDGDVPFVEE